MVAATRQAAVQTMMEDYRCRCSIITRLSRMGERERGRRKADRFVLRDWKIKQSYDQDGSNRLPCLISLYGRVSDLVVF